MATHSSILAWKIPWIEEPGRYSLWGCRVGHDWTHTHTWKLKAKKAYSPGSPTGSSLASLSKTNHSCKRKERGGV